VRCQPAVCGDGHVNDAAGEECEPPPGVDSPVCNGISAGAVACRLSRCGDGYVNTKAGEQCEKSSDCASGICNSCTCG
jgi:hypothetical protein